MDPADRARLERAAREALAVAIGLGVLGLNRIQAERRRLKASLGCRDGSDRRPGRSAGGTRAGGTAS